MSMLLFHFLFVLPFFFFIKKRNLRILLLIGSILPDLFSIPHILNWVHYAYTQNVFATLAASLVVGMIISFFSKEMSGLSASLILYAGSLNHLLVDFVSHPFFSPLFPIEFTLMDGFSHPVLYYVFIEWDWITVMISGLLLGSVVCMWLSQKLYYKKDSPLYFRDKFVSEI